MALEIKLSALEQNDCAALVLTDTTLTDSTGWDESGNAAITDIAEASNKLELSIVYTNILETITYDTINCYTVFGGPFTTQADLEFTLLPTMLKVSGITEFASDSVIPDGLWNITYTYGTTVSTYQLDMFVEGDIRNKIYERMRNLPSIYNAYDSRSQEISDTILMYSMLKSLEAMAYVALTDELINTLDALEKLYSNGSNYTWQQ
jgi:hypothetical protein